MHWCKGSVRILINQHRDFQSTIIEHLDRYGPGRGRIGQEIVQNMIKLDFLVQIDFTPETPITAHVVWHYDLDQGLDDCVEIIRNKETIHSLKIRNNGPQ
ncbi:hypothetical protein SAMN04487996_10443 [Dyadobacter soli]|uniref:Uncharacterized protein n=1 Tax=Dyadobacter soli TaxID=659014 RepID=A0A1G7B3B7_9BACT|nr:hypothetical protein SAMN04487996_10443 [Dyadobacter soli]